MSKDSAEDLHKAQGRLACASRHKGRKQLLHTGRNPCQPIAWTWPGSKSSKSSSSPATVKATLSQLAGRHFAAHAGTSDAAAGKLLRSENCAEQQYKTAGRPSLRTSRESCLVGERRSQREKPLMEILQGSGANCRSQATESVSVRITMLRGLAKMPASDSVPTSNLPTGLRVASREWLEGTLHARCHMQSVSMWLIWRNSSHQGTPARHIQSFNDWCNEGSFAQQTQVKNACSSATTSVTAWLMRKFGLARVALHCSQHASGLPTDCHLDCRCASRMFRTKCHKPNVP